MNVDRILHEFNQAGVEYILIGGMNFLRRCDAALRVLGAEWGPTEDAWRKIEHQPGWLTRQSVYCLTSVSGAIDIFRAVAGLPSWDEAAARTYDGKTAAGVAYRGLGDEDMITCQLALPEEQRRHDRVTTLRRASGGSAGHRTT
jgi:hypothetical protein